MPQPVKPKRDVRQEWGVYNLDGTLRCRAPSRRKASELSPGGLPIRKVRVTTVPDA